MEYIFHNIQHFFIKIWDARDRRSEHLPLAHRPLLVFAIVGAYIYIVLNGERFMRHRKPMEIKKIIIVYNILQIITNSAQFILGTYHLMVEEPKFNFVCEAIDYRSTHRGMLLVHHTYFYFLLKLADYFDTIFFILRKKSDHVSFLHVYHHVLISLGAYYGLLYYPGGNSVLLGYLNVIVHALMYSYYLMTILKPELKSNQLIKKNITRIQMIQFAILVVHFGYGLIRGNDCGFPKMLSFLAVTQNIFMLVLFANFYRKAYKNKKCAEVAVNSEEKSETETLNNNSSK